MLWFICNIYIYIYIYITTVYTSLLQEVQTSEQCIKALSIAQAAGERVLSGVGNASRWPGPPKQ